MSLSRILNDDPSPALLRPAVPSVPGPMSVIDPALMSPTSQTGPKSSPRLHHGYPEYQGEPSAPPRSYQATAYQGTGGWDPYSGEWVQGDIFPLGRGNGDYYSRPENSSSHDSRSAYYTESEVDGLSRKRRREPDEDDDYRPLELRQGRVSTILTPGELHL
jgi:DNA helicase INO80